MMASFSQTWMDRSRWPDGPWSDEPDRIEWYDRATGYPCLMLRNVHLGHWCGYVGLPPGHPWYDVTLDELPDEAYAHSDLTFAGRCMSDARPMRERVCHTPRAGEPDAVYWIGFDCANHQQLVPALSDRLYTRDDVYVTADEVAAVCTCLASLAIAAAER